MDTVILFARCSTQWRVGTAGLIGLDYSVLFAMMELYAVKDKKAMLEGIQIMESAAISFINKVG